jgi:hypothetical protein
MVLAFSAVPVTAQPPAAAPGGTPPRPPVEIDITAPVEDFKTSALNQPGKQYPEVNSQHRARTVLKAPNAQNVMLDLSGVRYPMTNWRGRRVEGRIERS